MEILGNYDARRGEKSEFKGDRVTYWMSQGAQLSDTVHNLLIDKKIITGKKINALSKKSPIVDQVALDAAKAAAEKVAAAVEAEKMAKAEAAKAAEAQAAEPVVETPAPEAEATPAEEVAPEVAVETPVAEEVAAA